MRIVKRWFKTVCNYAFLILMFLMSGGVITYYNLSTVEEVPKLLIILNSIATIIFPIIIVYLYNKINKSILFRKRYMFEINIYVGHINKLFFEVFKEKYYNTKSIEVIDRLKERNSTIDEYIDAIFKETNVEETNVEEIMDFIIRSQDFLRVSRRLTQDILSIEEKLPEETLKRVYNILDITYSDFCIYTIEMSYMLKYRKVLKNIMSEFGNNLLELNSILPSRSKDDFK